jgi:hypothetical protein
MMMGTSGGEGLCEVGLVWSCSACCRLVVASGHAQVRWGSDAHGVQGGELVAVVVTALVAVACCMLQT